MKKILLLITIFLQVNLYSQYGCASFRCEITLRNPNKEIRLFQHQFVSPYGLCQGKKPQKKELKSINNKYYAEGIKGDCGTVIPPIILINKRDTMRVFMPIDNSMQRSIYLNVPFRKGDYHIPYYAYVVHRVLKPEYRKKLKPNLNGDWSDFEIHKKPYKNIYFRRSKLIYSKCNHKYNYEKMEKKLKRTDYPFKRYLVNDRNDRRVWPQNFIGYHNNKINFIVVIKNKRLVIYQEKQNGPIEYGIIKAPRYNPLPKYKYKTNIKFDLDHSTFVKSKQNKPIIYGSYESLGKCDGGRQYYGLFEIVIEPDKNTIKKIKEEHNADNGN